MMMALLSLLPIYGFATLFKIYMRRNVSVSIFFSITAIISVLFIFSISGLLEFGYNLLYYGGIIILGVMSVVHKEELLKVVKSVPFIVYTFVSILYLYFMKDAHFFFWDEYSHWGAFIKYMYHTNSLYDLNTSAAHLNYPPGISLWDYFVIKMFPYQEGNIYFAYFLLIFSSTLMMYERLTWKDIHWIVLVFIVQVVLFADFGHWFSSIYVDHVISSVSIGLILAYISDKYKSKELLLFVFPLSSIVLIKEIGLYFGLSFLGFVYLSILLSEFEIKKENFFKLLKKTKSSFILLLVLFLIMFGTLQVWSKYQEDKGISNNKQTLSAVAKNIFLGKHLLNEEVESKIKIRLEDVLFHQQLHKEKVSLNYNEFSYGTMKKYTKEMKLTTVGIFIFFIFVFIVRYILFRQERKKLFLMGSYFLFISAVYIFFILYQSYFVAFGTDALRTPSFVRYANIAILPLMFLLFVFFLPVYTRETKNKTLFLVASVVLLIVILITRPYLQPLYSQLPNKTRVAIDKMTQNITKQVPANAKLFVIFPIKNNGSLNNMLKYSLIPIHSNVSHYDFEKKSFNEMLRTYSKYEYIWFAQFDKVVFDKNRKLLRGKANKTVYTLYKISKDNQSLQIKPIL